MEKRKMSISTKLIISFISISVVSIIVGVIAIVNLRQLNAYNNQLYQKELLGLSYVKEANIDLIYMVRSEKNFLLSPSVEDRNTYAKQRDDDKALYLKNMDLARPLFTTEDELKEFAQVDASYKDWVALDDQVMALGKQQKLNEDDAAAQLSMGEAHDKTTVLDDNLTDLTKLKETIAANTADAGTRAFLTSLVIMIAVIAVGFALGVFLGILIARSISKPVTRYVTDLSESSSQIGNSSGQLSQASMQIANGAQEQASQIEETTAAMEELASMVKQNVENAKAASVLANQSKDSSTIGFEQMEKMLESMQGIAKSTENIRGVIDVIDDIAFQTNMLALNAAVEAARAGEAGMGFAVVADEVKNLANRSASSAKETALMIKDSIGRIEDGMETAKHLAEIFKAILGSSGKVSEMSQEVEAASRQQDEGIGQVNKAIIQFDTVVQNNASSSEETASAAEELQSQVENLNSIVNNLHVIVTGREFRRSQEGSSTGSRPPRQGQGQTQSQDRVQPVRALPPPQNHSNGTKVVAPARNGTAGSDTETGPKKNRSPISFENDEDFGLV